MSKVNSIVQVISALWIISEIILSISRRAKNTSKDRNKPNSLIILVINIISITIGVNIAAAAKAGSGGIGSLSAVYPLFGYIGLVLIILGIVLRWTAILTLKRQFTTTLAIIENHKVIDIGIYKYIRHPSYTGCLMSFLGLSVSFANWITFIVIFIPILFGYIYRINIEEKLLVTGDI